MSTQGSTKVALRDRNLALKLLTNPVGAMTSAVLAVVTLCAVFASALTPYDPALPDFMNINMPPDTAHWLGTDSLGRDILSRIIVASRFSLAGALVAIVVASIIGCSIGLIAGYFGGLAATLGDWLSNVLQALPGIVVLLAAATVIGPSMYGAMVILGVLISPAFYRLVFVTVRAVRNELYVDAARVSGLGDFKIITRHVLGVVRAPIIIQSGFVASIAIAIQAGLQFLGLGDVSTETWGKMLIEGFTHIWDYPIQLLWPSLVLGVVSLSLVMFTGVLRDEMERTGSRVRKSTARSISDHVKQEQVAPAIVHPEPNRHGEELVNISKLEIGYLQVNGKYTVVVHDSKLSINKGEVVGLVGESGSGKTQTALALLGLLPAGGTILDGSITFDGVELTTLSSREYGKLRGARISYIPQEPMSNLDPCFTIGNQLVEPIRFVLGLSKDAAKAKALTLLDMVGLPDPEKTFNSYPHEVSGGQAQRVLIARALSCDPDLIIADEPTTALDVTIQAEILDVLRDLQNRTGVAILLVTHNFGVVADLCDRVAVMQYGRIVESGSVLDIFEDPQHPYTRQLLAAILSENGPARAAYVVPSALAGA